MSETAASAKPLFPAMTIRVSSLAPSFVRGNTWNGRGPGPDQICCRGLNLCRTSPLCRERVRDISCHHASEIDHCCSVDLAQKRDTCYAVSWLASEGRRWLCKHPRWLSVLSSTASTCCVCLTQGAGVMDPPSPAGMRVNRSSHALWI